MLQEVYTRRIKAPTGDGTANLKITPTPGVRLHGLHAAITTTGGTNTVAALATALTEIRIKVGTAVRSRMSGTVLRDWLLLHGTTYDWAGLPNTATQVTIPFAPEWYNDPIANSLAWNPAILGGDITVEIDATTALTTKWYEKISDDIGIGGQSSGIVTHEVIKPVAGGTSFFVEKEIDLRGRLLAASIYPDSTNSNEITPASLFLGTNDVYAHEALTSTENDEELNRYSLTPAASGRTANIYDIVPVKSDMLARGFDLASWGDAKFKIEAASAMAGTCSILLVRLEAK